MVVKKKQAKAKMGITHKVREEKEEENEGGLDLDDAFSDDEDVEYAESKPKKKKAVDEEELEEELDKIEEKMNGKNEEESNHQVKASKPMSKVKKGDKVTIDGKQYEVDSHYCLIDHGSTKEMAVEMFDAKADKDYQLRYFDDQVEGTLELYELQEILYIKKHFVKISW
ncbi:MAG: hypothetical protein AABW80_02260 [Nanoarchaeota archaeon]